MRKGKKIGESYKKGRTTIDIFGELKAKKIIEKWHESRKGWSEEKRKEISEKISKAGKGRVSTFKGKKHSKETIEKIKYKRSLQKPTCSKPTLKLNLKGEVIEEFESVVAAEKVLGEKIRKYVLGKNNHIYKGFIWQFKKNYETMNEVN